MKKKKLEKKIRKLADDNNDYLIYLLEQRFMLTVREIEGKREAFNEVLALLH